MLISMKKISIICCLLCCNANAKSDFLSGVVLGAGASATSGFNLIVGYHNPYVESGWLKHFGARIDFAVTAPLKSVIDSVIDSYMRDGRDVGDGVRIDNGKLDSWHSGLLVDFYPFVGAWRLTGGFLWGNASLGASIFGTVENAPSERFYFYLAGDHYYYNGNSFDGTTTIDWNYSGPYFGTGFDIGLGCGFNLYLDAGIVLTSQPATLDINVPNGQLYVYNKETSNWSPVEIPQLTADVLRAEQDANRKLSDIRVYPMVKLGFLYRF